MSALQEFKKSHPEQQVWFDSTPWTYHAGGRGPRGLLVLGGALSFGDSNHRLVSLFEPTRRVLAPSYPPVRSVLQITDGLVQLLDRERLQRVDVFGHSLGAGIAHVFARRHCDRVDRLALSSFGLCSPLHALETRLALGGMKWLPEPALRSWSSGVFRRLGRDAGEKRAAELAELARDVLGRHTRRSMLDQAALMGDLCRHAHAYRLDEPVLMPGKVLLLFASDDTGFTRAEQDALARTYPGAIVSRFVNAGHLIGLTHAQELHRKLEFFFRITPAQAALPTARSA